MRQYKSDTDDSDGDGGGGDEVITVRCIKSLCRPRYSFLSEPIVQV